MFEEDFNKEPNKEEISKEEDEKIRDHVEKVMNVISGSQEEQEISILTSDFLLFTSVMAFNYLAEQHDDPNKFKRDTIALWKKMMLTRISDNIRKCDEIRGDIVVEHLGISLDPEDIRVKKIGTLKKAIQRIEGIIDVE